MKAQERSARFGCSGIHLSAARGFIAGNQSDNSLPVQLAKFFPGLNCRHHPLGNFWGYWQAVHQINDELIVIPGRNDQADQRARYVAVPRREPRQHLFRTWCIVRHILSFTDNELPRKYSDYKRASLSRSHCEKRLSISEISAFGRSKDPARSRHRCSAGQCDLPGIGRTPSCRNTSRLAGNRLFRTLERRRRNEDLVSASAKGRHAIHSPM